MKEEDNSSLELLLDTMCNTFGGVMFIAITLAVVLFSRNALEAVKSPEQRHEERQEELLRRMDELKAKLRELAQRRQEMLQTTRILEADPRMRSLQQIALLEALVKDETIRKAVLGKELGIVETELGLKKDEQATLQKELETQRDAVGKMVSQVQEKEKILEFLSQELKEAMPVNMAFTVLSTHDNRPSYFILLKNGRLWRVGPKNLSPPDGIPKPVEDVSYTLKGNRVLCIPKKEAGCEAMTGEQLSLECRRMMAGIPSDRGAVFCFGKEDAELFYKMREELKRLGIFHGFSISPDTSVFSYVVTAHTHYEY